MAKKSVGLGSVVNNTEPLDPKASKRAEMKAKMEAKKAARAEEAEALIQARGTKTRGARAAVKKEVAKAEPKDCPKCPCCGERTTNPKSYFLTGHDGRMKGWFTKKSQGKLKDVDFSEEVDKMYKLWKKGDGLTIKEIVKKVRGIKE